VICTRLLVSQEQLQKRPECVRTALQMHTHTHTQNVHGNVQYDSSDDRTEVEIRC